MQIDRMLSAQPNFCGRGVDDEECPKCQASQAL